MSDVFITDAVLAAAFTRADGPLAVCAADGHVLGYFTPAKPSLRHLQPLISEEELRRREADTEARGYTTAEVLAKLKAL